MENICKALFRHLVAVLLTRATALSHKHCQFFTFTGVACLSYLFVFPPMAVGESTTTTQPLVPDLNPSHLPPQANNDENLNKLDHRLSPRALKTKNSRAECPCLPGISQCSVAPDALQMRILLPLKNVDQSFHASDFNETFAWPRAVEVVIELRSSAYSPFCVTAHNISTSLIHNKDTPASNLLIEIKLSSLLSSTLLSANPKLNLSVIYGLCAPIIQSFGFHLAVKTRKDFCQLRLDAIWKHDLCSTPFENCKTTRVIKIPTTASPNVHYGFLFCVFHDSIEFPDNKTMLQQLASAERIEVPMPSRQSLLDLEDDSEIRTFFAYGGILLILFILLLITLIQKRRQRKPLAANMLQFLKADEWELNESDVLIQYVHKIGNGSTAEVYRGKLSKDFRTPANGPVVLDESYQVAVKILKKNANEAQKTEFLAELEISKLIGRNNRIVNLIGVMQLRRPPLIVFEICPNGDLRRCLHKCRQYVHELASKGYSIKEMDDINAIPQVNENFVFTFKRLIRLAIQICLGMEYLASRQLIHGDLASRNVFLTSKSSIKIGDYGLCRKESDSSMLSTFILTDNRARWAAPEILQREYQCLASDVWSYGVLLYELVTLGAIPYHNISTTTELATMLNNGYRLGKPTHCPDKLYTIMNTCWIRHSSDRPSFPFITSSMTDFYDSVDTKDNEANFYVTPDPRRELYTLPLAKATTIDSPAPASPAPPSFTMDSQPATPRPPESPTTINAKHKNSKGLTVKLANNASKNSTEKKEELIHETERLLGFS